MTPVPARHSITALIFSFALPLAHGAEEVAEGVPKLRKIPAISVLPDGSELDGVVLPRYDKQLRLTGSLHAGKLTLVSSDIIRGEQVRIQLIDPDREDGNVSIELGNAVLDQLKGVVRAEEAVTIESTRFTATGTALHLEFDAGRGFVSGPATTLIHPLPKTAMHTPASQIRHPRLATAVLGMAVATSAVIHARPPAVSEAEVAELRAAATTRAPELETRINESRDALASASDASAEISATARTFLINQVLEPGEPVPEAPQRPEAQPLEAEVDPDDTRILCDGGFFFDAEEGILVYLQNVRVTDPRFSLEGVDELKIIFAKKPEEAGQQPPAGEGGATPEPADEDPAAGFGAGLGEVERVIATGRVLFKQRQPKDGEAPVEASGALFNYDVAKGEIILSGGFPWVRQGGYYARALQANLNLRIKRDGSFVTEGQWEMKGRLDNNNRR